MIIDEIKRFRTINELKSIYRANSVKNRHESSAEHSWSSLLLADLLLRISKIKLDKLKLYEIIIRHDLIEIETGDTPLTPNNYKNKKEITHKYVERLIDKIPKVQIESFLTLYDEQNKRITREAKFAKLVDQLDAVIHELDYKNDWKGWTRNNFIQSKISYLEDFPELENIFIELLDYLIDNEYIIDEMTYALKNNEDIYIKKIEDDEFDKIFESYTKPFFRSGNRLTRKSRNKYYRNNSKATYIVEGSNHNLYSGVLWNDNDIEAISNMDYMYSLPAWDWWIEPVYKSNKYRKEFLDHIPNKYGYTAIFVDNNIKREKEYRKILKKEGYKIINIKRQYENNDLSFYIFYDYWMVMLPLKLAREIKRIEKDIAASKQREVYFLLRGGKLISDLIDNETINHNVIEAKSKFIKNNKPYIVDDCIVRTRTLKKLKIEDDSQFHLAVLDSAAPSYIYKDKYINASLSMPDDLINFFSCRLFEKNPFLIGADIINGEIVNYTSAVRQEFIKKILSFKNISDIDIVLKNIISSLMEDKFNNDCEDREEIFDAK